jgi:hypothetical protein
MYLKDLTRDHIGEYARRQLDDTQNPEDAGEFVPGNFYTSRSGFPACIAVIWSTGVIKGKDSVDA